MSIFQTMNLPSQHSVTRISQVTDEEIWRHLVTPTVKGLLGSIIKVESNQVLDTVAGLFPGDEVTNLNGHMLADANGKLSKDYVRFPYNHTLYRTVNGAMVIKRDGVKFEVFCWFGDIDRGKGELIFKAALRDRVYDGTKRANDCALLEYAYDNPDYHKRLSTVLSSVELSIYGFMPGSRIIDATGDKVFDQFVTNPFLFLDNPQAFLSLFHRAFKSKRGPGQYSAAIPDVAKYSLAGFERLASKYGYDLIEMAASHYHVAKWAQAGGYAYSDPAQAEMVAKLQAGLGGHPRKRYSSDSLSAILDLRAAEPAARRLGAQWVPHVWYRFVALLDGRSDTEQTASQAGEGDGEPPQAKVETAKHLLCSLWCTRLRWPQNNVDDECLWLYKPLSAKAQGFIPNISFQPKLL
jgi:hypothetical protein